MIAILEDPGKWGNKMLDQIEDKLFKTGDRMTGKAYMYWNAKSGSWSSCHSSHVHQRQFCVAKLMRSTWQTSLQGWGSQLFTVFIGSCSDLAPCRTCTTCPSGELQNKRTKSQEAYGFLHKSRVDKFHLAPLGFSTVFLERQDPEQRPLAEELLLHDLLESKGSKTWLPKKLLSS